MTNHTADLAALDRENGRVDLHLYGSDDTYTEAWDTADAHSDDEYPFFIAVTEYHIEEDPE